MSVLHFDASFFEAISTAPQPEIAPPDDLSAVEIFDWDAYNRAFFETLPERAKRSEENRVLASIAGAQLWLARRLPSEAVAFLLQNIAAKSLWKHLTGENRYPLLHTATRGFQRTPQIVRQAVVRARMVHWLEQNRAEIYPLLMMWSSGEPQPPIIAVAQADDESHQLPILIRKFGVEAALCALSFAARPKTFAALIELRADEEKLGRLLQNSDEEENPCEAEPAPEVGESVPIPDSEAAIYWKEQFEAGEETRRQLCESLAKTLDAGDKNRLKLDQRSAELESLQKREKTGVAQAAKKLENLEQRLGGELSELRKNFERQTRKLRALEREKIEMDNENRRFKKQLRHTAQLLEEERKKVAVLERSQPKIEVAPAPIDSILTPAASQSAPNRPVVVQPPTPLDEIFEWRADGRQVKTTPRTVRRLIDHNDEDAVFGIMQALESLRHSDRSTHGKFLKRLGESGAYYPRVLTESMARILVDASNVARHTPNRYGKGQLRHLLEMRDELRRLDCFPILFYADASLRYFIDEANTFRDMVAQGEILVADKGVEADEILAREARRSGAYVVTNDAKFFHKVSPDFEPPRVSFRIYDGTVIVDDF